MDVALASSERTKQCSSVHSRVKHHLTVHDCYDTSCSDEPATHRLARWRIFGASE